MLNINQLPLINTVTLGKDIPAGMIDTMIIFKTIERAPWFLRVFSKFFKEDYMAYKETIYTPTDHLALATSDDLGQRTIATSKLLPWVYAIRHGSVPSLLPFIYTMLNTQVRLYYFIFEYVLLNIHENSEVPRLAMSEFLSTRRNIWGTYKNPNSLLVMFKQIFFKKLLHYNNNHTSPVHTEIKNVPRFTGPIH